MWVGVACIHDLGKSKTHYEMGPFSARMTTLPESSASAFVILRARQCLSDHRRVCASVVMKTFSSNSNCSGVRPIRLLRRSRTRMGTNETIVRTASFMITLGECRIDVKVSELGGTVVDATVCKISPIC